MVVQWSVLLQPKNYEYGMCIFIAAAVMLFEDQAELDGKSMKKIGLFSRKYH